MLKRDYLFVFERLKNSQLPRFFQNLTKFFSSQKRLPDAAPLVVDLLVELMGILASYNITVKELKMLFSAMKAVDNKWVCIL